MYTIGIRIILIIVIVIIIMLIRSAPRRLGRLCCADPRGLGHRSFGTKACATVGSAGDAALGNGNHTGKHG